MMKYAVIDGTYDYEHSVSWHETLALAIKDYVTSGITEAETAGIVVRIDAEVMQQVFELKDRLDAIGWEHENFDKINDEILRLTAQY